MRDVSFSGCTAVAISTINARIEERYSATELKKTTQAAAVKTDTASVSTLSRQLGESAIRAEARDKSMTRQQLGEFATSSIAYFSPESSSAKKALHDAEIPKTDDPELLERARQATIYVNKAAAQDPTAKNPFAGLTREQAALIAYDDKGPYTANERCAALRHGNNLEEQWRAGLMARGWQESNSNGGRAPKFMTECLDHYRALPAIEQARYDEGYEGRLLTSIKEHGGPAKPTERNLNLYEILAGIEQPGKKKEEQTAVAKQPQSASKVIKDEKAPAPASAPLNAKQDEFRILSLFEILAGHRYPDTKDAKKQPDNAAKLAASQTDPIAPKPTPTTNSLSPGASPTPADARRS
ncbi:hypothetical protein [Pseudomonas syringae]|uniref:hypothetical protein n=1 Tax=Pseudomonas syringae TaxID=317 RepID=UPI00067C92C0|nr:hypothetical protein [Pseudomonas syringae]